MKITEKSLSIISAWMSISALISLYLLLAHFNFVMTIAVERSQLELWFNTFNVGVWSFIYSVAIYKIYLHIKEIKR